MAVDVSERAFEEAIECALLAYGPDACSGDATQVRETVPPWDGEPSPAGLLGDLEDGSMSPAGAHGKRPLFILIARILNSAGGYSALLISQRER